MKIDIVIPTFGQEQFTVKCLESIRKYTDEDKYRIVWVDNGSSRSSRNTVFSELSNHKNYTTVWLQENMGFVKATNEGIKIGDSKYVILQNNDTEVTKGWLDDMLVSMERDRYIGILGPLTNAKGSWQGWKNVKAKMLPYIPNDLEKMSKDEVSVKLKSIFKESLREVQMVAFFCSIVRREVFNKCGLLDEVFGVGFGDDDDFCMRARKANYKVCFRPSVFVYHHHRTTFKDVYGETEIKKMQNKNLNIYKSKHNILK